MIAWKKRADWRWIMSETNDRLIHELIGKYIKGTLSDKEADLLLERAEKDPAIVPLIQKNIQIDLFLQKKYDLLREEQILASAPQNGFVSSDEMNSLLSELVQWEKNAVPIPSMESHAKNQIEPTRKHSFWRMRISQKPKKDVVYSPPSFAKNLLFVSQILVLVGLCSWLSINHYLSTLPPKQEPFRSLAMITDTIDTEWENDVFKRGQEIRPNRIALKKGIVRILFDDGTDLILEGPADFVINDLKKVFCSRGKISVSVSPMGKGFEVLTPFTKYIDQGTEFVVHVSDKDSVLEVIKGEVDVSSSPNIPFIKLLSGEGIRTDVNKKMEKIKADLTRFTDHNKFRSLQIAYAAKQQKLITGRNKLIDSDRDLLARYNFSDDHKGPFPNCAQGPGSVKSNAVPYGESQCAGSCSETKACQIRHKSSGIELNIPGSMNDFTFITSVRIDRLREYGNVIFSSNESGTVPGAVIFQILRNGSLQLQIRQPDIRSKTHYNSDPFFKRNLWGTWCHLAVCADSRKKEIAFYVDGKLLSRMKWERPLPLLIGNATFGRVLKDESKTDRILDGAVEEILIFQRALSENEIKRLTP